MSGPITRTRPWRQALTYLRRGARLSGGHSEESPRPRDWEEVYRARWQHDKVVRSTHGVNCTGSCSWNVYVKDGIVTWETQATDYPSLGPEMPEYEPRGCARGASFSWYLYSPLRVKHPYVRGVLLDAWRRVRALGLDPVEAWERLMDDPDLCRSYRRARGKGGLVRASWAEALELVAASLVHTIRRYGPDRVVGFTPIPAMSMVSYVAGARFLSLLGGVMLSFYDWYSDLPPASPQIWGEQTDVPESADWYNAAYYIMWGQNIPLTRTPDAHFMTEARYRGAKVVGISPDFAESSKFADLWLAPRPGTDGAMAMAMAHVIVQEFYIDRPEPYFLEYARRFTDLPYLVELTAHDGDYRAGTFVRAADIGVDTPLAEWKPIVWDERREAPAVPTGSVGHRWDGMGRWRLGDEDENGAPVAPLLTFAGRSERTVTVAFPAFDRSQGRILRRSVPVRRLAGRHGELVVTTVFDLLCAHLGVQRVLGAGAAAADAPGTDEEAPYTPAWQEAITGVDRRLVRQVALEFARTAARTRGRAMITLGSGVNHWYHSDQIYRAILTLVLLTGCEGRNGGGWAHYTGQEKVRPIEGWSTLAFALDWSAPPRQQNATSFFYFATDQHRYEETDPAQFASPLGGRLAHLSPADVNALAVRLGWLPCFPQYDENPLDSAERASADGAAGDREIVDHVVRRLVSGELTWSIESPDRPVNHPRVLFVWRANLLGASGKGHEFFLSHLLGADGHALAEPNGEAAPPHGKLDLLVDIDFRMTSSGLYADVVLPAATWYEKTDLSSTDMHPFIHPFNPAISPPWEARSDWVTFTSLASVFSRLAERHLGVRKDVVLAPLMHDTPDELAQPGGRVLDWRKGEVEAVPGRTMPHVSVVHRDYPAVYARMTSLGPRARERIAAKGIAIDGAEAYDELARLLGRRIGGAADGCPALESDRDVAEAILRLSGTTNGRRALAQWRALERPTGLRLAHVAEGHADTAYSLSDLTAQPRAALATPVWSGLEAQGRRYAPYTANVELSIPWRTLTGRQHLYLDHELLADFGESLPVYRPPLALGPFTPGDRQAPPPDARTVTVRYLTPHGKWAIHSMYAEDAPMLTLFRGGPTVWVSVEDARAMGIADNAWIEVYNRNGAIAARAVVSHRIPAGVAFMYHASDRTVGVPATRVTGDRGGTHNSVVRVSPKPTHMIGGYAQLSYAFNYYGPTGHQRDSVAYIRPLEEVRWLED